MTERDANAPIGVDGLTPSAGAMLRAAREKRGIHIAALAASMKVPQRKLEALEADRYDELPDLTFTRALAQSMCRALKVDFAPVLERLPQAPGDMPRLARVGGGINAPFQERPGREEPKDRAWLRHPVLWLTLLVALAAAVMAFVPEAWLGSLRDRFFTTAAPSSTVTAPVTTPVAAPPTPVVESASAPAAPASSVVVETPTAVVPGPAATATEPVVATLNDPSAPLVFKTRADSWIEVQDAAGQTPLSRNVAAGETVGVGGKPPFRITVGNASATEVVLRGKTVDLQPSTVGNIARIQLN